ncbi:Hypothetical protein PBC10988_25040 [Planctomycetales bacterium 10988]|nr:Hypothetical protein PBC10988_25040 [Planctomycetales bacterium 10988]
MKTEHQSIKSHAPADPFERTLESAKPYIVPVLGVVVVSLILYFGYQFLDRQWAIQRAKAWEAYFALTAGSQEAAPDQLFKVAEDHTGTLAAEFARIQLADQKFNEGVNTFLGDGRTQLPNPVEGKELLEEAAEIYEEVTDSAFRGLVQDRARIGWAKALESLGKIDEAKAQYEMLAAGDSLYQQEASQRLANLQSQNMQSFYSSLLAYEPPAPPPATEDGPGVPGQAPPTNLQDLLDGSSFTPSTSLEEFTNPSSSEGSESEEMTEDAPAEESSESEPSESTEEKAPAEESKPESSEPESPETESAEPSTESTESTPEESEDTESTSEEKSAE